MKGWLTSIVRHLLGLENSPKEILNKLKREKQDVCSSSVHSAGFLQIKKQLIRMYNKTSIALACDGVASRKKKKK